LAAITHFFSINDVSLTRKKIKKFMSEAENKYEYRSYAVEDLYIYIQEAVSFASNRDSHRAPAWDN